MSDYISVGNMGAARARRALRAGAASMLALVLSMLFLPATPAIAAEGSFLADKSAWFWSSNSRVTTCTRPRFGQDGACQRAAGTDAANPISTGHIAVSTKDGTSDMRSYVHLDTSLIPSGSQITRYVVILTVSRVNDVHTQRHGDVQEKPPATVNETAAAIQACAVSEFFADGTEGDPPYSTKVTPGAPETPDPTDDETEIINTRNEPTFDCGLNAEGKPSADGKEWRFDITTMAQKWASLERFDEGIALIPLDKGVKPTWVVEFHGTTREKASGEENLEVVNKKEAARAEVEYTASAGPVVPPPPIDTGTGTPSVIIPPTDTGGTTTPTGTGTGTTTTPPVQTGGGVPVAAVRAPTPGWLMGVLLLGLIGVGLISTLIGGDPLTATNGSTSASRVASVLRGRRLAGGAALEAAHVIEEEEITSQE